MTGAEFQLDPVLDADTFDVADWPLCRVLLMNDCQYPWLILMPRRPGLSELHDLDSAAQNRLMDEIDRASRLLNIMYAPTKINVAALGNMVRQLHIHVIARFDGDPAWPRPIWGQHPPQPYAANQSVALIDRLRLEIG